MNKFTAALHTSLFVAITLAFTSLAQAQTTADWTRPVHTWVSAVGDDRNPCSRLAPCATFAKTISRTPTGGEIDVLDIGSFGPVMITKSITIDATGAFGGIIQGDFGLFPENKPRPFIDGAGIIINITEAGDTAKTVRLRGLSINGAGSAIDGIRVIAANKVSIEDTVIDGFSKSGINVEATSAAQVFVKNTTIRNNAGVGINVMGGGSQVALSDVTVVYNGTGLAATGGTIISFKNNIIYGNKKDGDPTSSVTPR